MPKISITQLARNLADIVNRVAYRGERFTVIRGNRPVAELVPTPRGRPLSELPAILESLPRLGEDDATTWSRELDQAREELGRPGGDPWRS